MNRNTIINKIARKSKTAHVPVRESIQKTFLAKAIADDRFDMSVLNRISIRDKFKYLNLLAYKKQQNTVDAFVVRNGKLFAKEGRAVWTLADIMRVERAILTNLAEEFVGLRDKKILLDSKIELGLPTSRKQTLGNLPHGTRVKIEDDKISAGIYWENEWGARDIDLSAIDMAGNRTGWGNYSGYDQENEITYSGDMTDATNGAAEFMTSATSEYALFSNIYSGKTGTEYEIVIGGASNLTVEDNKDEYGYNRPKTWMENPILREKVVATSNYMMFGTVRGKEFVIYEGRVGSSRVSENGVNPSMARAMTDFWTVNKLFDAIGIEYDTVAWEDNYDFDLTYAGFSFEKLEEIFV